MAQHADDKNSCELAELTIRERDKINLELHLDERCERASETNSFFDVQLVKQDSQLIVMRHRGRFNLVALITRDVGSNRRAEGDDWG